MVSQGCGGLDIFCIGWWGITPHLDEHVEDRGGGGPRVDVLDDESMRWVWGRKLRPLQYQSR
jgi:hypothetical protein